MDPLLFLVEMSESEECQKIMYKRLAIKMLIGLYYAMKPERGSIDPFMIPFRDFIKRQIEEYDINADELLKYMIENDQSSCSLFLANTLFTPKEGLSPSEFMSSITVNKVLTPYVDIVDMDVLALIVVSFVFDNLSENKIDIREIVGTEEFLYPTNQYGLSKVNGAVFKRDGLIFDGKGYFYNYFTNKTLLSPYDKMVGFARIINEEAGNCDILYRIDERLSVPESEFYDYTGVSFAKYRGPNFDFTISNLDGPKTIIVHIDENTSDKLLMVIKQDFDQNINEAFWHIEIETLPYRETSNGYVITTFLHGMYYPHRSIFSHIDYTKNQYSGTVYSQKYADSQNGIPIDQYTESRSLHYKIWCIENGEFSKETWYRLMIVSLPEKYQKLLNEMLIS